VLSNPNRATSGMAREAPPRRPGPVGRAAPPYASTGMMGSNQSGDLARAMGGGSEGR
jgi:hypothetical protein